jgi:acyl-ACP thioesterase
MILAVTAQLSEILPATGHGRVFAFPVGSGLADVSPSGRVRLDAIARWLQDAAHADLKDALPDEESVWVVRRTRIRVQRFPPLGEACIAQTWCSGTGSMWAERRTTITGDHALIEAVALWVCIDASRGRPIAPSSACAAIYAASAGGRRVKARLRHPQPAPQAKRSTWRFRAAELDMAAHINNAAYWTILEEELAAGPEPVTFDAEIEFRAGAIAGDVGILRAGSNRWIVVENDEVAASVAIADPS